MSFAVSASTTRAITSARAPVKARNATVAAFAAPVASKASAAKLAARHATAGIALRATGASTVARAGRNMRVLAGRFEAERTYIMIKPDGVQRGYVRFHARLSSAIATAGFSPAVLFTRRASPNAGFPRAAETHARFRGRAAVCARRDERIFFSPRAREARAPSVDASSLTARDSFASSRLRPRKSTQVGDIVSRFEKKGFVLKGMKMFQCPKEVAEEHYEDLSEKPFFGDLVDYIVSGPVMCMVWEGPGAVKACRLMIGETNPLVSNPGTIRGDLAVEVGRNVIHGSDSVESAEREIKLWFGGEENLIDWEPTNMPWVREG